MCFTTNTSAQSIHAAVRLNNIEQVKLLLKENSELVNARDDDSNTPLILACVDSKVSLLMVKLLIESGADLHLGDQDKDTPLHYAAYGGNIEAAKILIENKAEIDFKDANGLTPLHLALIKRHSETAKLFVEHGANINAKVNYSGNTPLFLALSASDEEFAEILISKGANLDVRNNNGRLPLYLALDICSSKIVNQILDINSTIDLEQDGAYLMEAAVGCENNRLVNILINQGIDVTGVSPIGQTLMHKAAKSGMIDLMKTLADKGVSVDQEDVYGQLPIHIGAMKGHTDAVELLLDKGADINSKNPIGKTALHLAIENENTEIRDLLIKRGADQKEWKFPKLKSAYLDKILPKKDPLLFAPGIISTEEGFEYAISFHPDGKEMLVSKRVPENIYDNNRIMSMKMENKSWTPLKLTSFASDYKSGESIYSPDGQHIIFGSSRPAPGTTENKFDTWIVDYSNKEGVPQLLPEPFKIPQYLMYISSTIDNKIYFTSEGGIYSAMKTETGYKEASILGSAINRPTDGVHPFIAPDESYLIFDSKGRPSGLGESDLYISFRKEDGSWTKAQNLGNKINSTADEICASISGDGKYLFYHSKRNGNGDIYWVDTSFMEELKKTAISLNTEILKPQNQTLGKTRSFSVVHGDLDGNGYQDILMVNYFSPSRIWFNNGDNTFEMKPNNIATKDQEEHGGAIADLDNDGDLDIVIVTTGKGENKIYLNDGTGQFVASKHNFLTKGNGYGHVDLKDADGDGDLDAFLLVYTGSNEIWLNNGHAVFTKSNQVIGGENSRTMGLADLDGDDDVDIFLARTDASEEVWLNDGKGSYVKSENSLGNQDGMESIALADFDKDGDIDAAVANMTYGITIWLNDGKGTFLSKGAVFSHSRSINSSDIDNDGDIDLYSSDRIKGDVVLLNDGNANFSEVSLINEISIASGIVDIDNDGDLDLILSKGERSNGNCIYVNQTIK